MTSRSLFPRIKFSEAMFAGWLAGAMARTIINPLDVVKVKQQVGRGKRDGMVLTMIDSYQDEGFTGLFKGNLMGIVRQLPYTIMRGIAVDYTMDIFSWFGTKLNTSTMIVSILGGAAATALTQPIDVIRTRLITQDLGKRKYKNAIDAVETIIREEGYAGLFKGADAAVIRVIPFELGLYVGNRLSRQILSPTDSPLLRYMIESAVANTMSYPFEVIRRKLETQSALLPEEMRADVVCTNVVDCFEEIVKSKGVAGLFAGWWTDVLRIVPQTLLTYFFYQFVRSSIVETKKELKKHHYFNY
jgi:hypothetical protein